MAEPTAENHRGYPLRVNLRIPYWARAGRVVSVNGEQTARAQLKANSFNSLKRKWQDGDTLELSLPMPLHLHAMPDDANVVALMAGPVVLAGLTGMALPLWW